MTHQSPPDAWTGKQARAVELAVLPPLLPEVFERLARAGSKASALFGGAARDADLSALWGVRRDPKDYDLRCWLAPGFMLRSDWEARFGLALLGAFEGSSLAMAPSAGTGRLRHAIAWRGLELDVSAGALPRPGAGSADAARERALDADASLSAVAVDEGLLGWCEAAYAQDRAARRLSYYPGVEPGRARAYRERMRAKFPGLPERFQAQEPVISAPAPKEAR